MCFTGLWVNQIQTLRVCPSASCVYQNCSLLHGRPSCFCKNLNLGHRRCCNPPLGQLQLKHIFLRTGTVLESTSCPLLADTVAKVPAGPRNEGKRAKIESEEPVS